jgi:YegS/Rv2252/BmrU family lipid kinase
MSHGRTFDLVLHGARAEHPGLRDAVEWMRTIGHRIRAHVTWEAGDARRFAEDAARRGSDAVLALGGDGTVNEVVNGLVGTGTPLGILPAGTANDFARQTGIPDDVRAALELVVEREPVTVDAVTLNGRAFLNVSSAGIGAETTAETGTTAKQVLGPIAYAITGVRKLMGDHEPTARASPARDSTASSSSCTSPSGNGGRPAPGTIITPQARLDDGLLDCASSSRRRAPPSRRCFSSCAAASTSTATACTTSRSRGCAVEADAPAHVNVDGEPQQLESLTYAVLPGALRVVLGQLPGDDAPESGHRGGGRGAHGGVGGRCAGGAGRTDGGPGRSRAPRRARAVQRSARLSGRAPWRTGRPPGRAGSARSAAGW